MVMKTISVWTVSLGVAAFALFGCEVSDKCGSNLEYVGRACQVPAAKPDAAAVATDAPKTGLPSTSIDAAAPSDTDDDGGAAPATSNFGATCKATSECTGASNLCAIQPGGTVGYCSASGCDTNPAACPANWTCIKFPGAPAFCMKSG